MKILKNLLPVVFVLLLVFLGYSLYLAPFSILHGYYVGAAKLMAQGLVPFQDFNLMDLPLGIGLLSIPYQIFGVKVGGILAVVFMGVVHLLNLVILRMLLKRVGIHRTARWVTLLFFFIILYSTDALYVTVETFALTFLLLALLKGEEKSSLSQGLSGLFFILAVLCKAQVIVMLPAVLLAIYLPLTGKKRHTRRALTFTGFCLLFALFAWFILTVSTGESQVWQRLDWHFFGGDNYVLQMLIAVCILAGRCSFYIILPGLFGWFTKHKRTRRFAFILLVAFLGQLVLVFSESSKASGMFLYPFVALCFAWTLQDLSERKHWLVPVFFCSTFLMPGYLMVREFMKLEMGDVKEEQQAYLDVLKEMYPKKTEVALLTFHCFESDLNSQIYSEVPTLIPFDLKTTKWGLNHWEDVPEGNYVRRAIADAPMVITNEMFLIWYDSMNVYTNEKWFEDFRLYLLHNQERMIGLGDFQIITKD